MESISDVGSTFSVDEELRIRNGAMFFTWDCEKLCVQMIESIRGGFFLWQNPA
jgi:hypothetical protein